MVTNLMRIRAGIRFFCAACIGGAVMLSNVGAQEHSHGHESEEFPVKMTKRRDPIFSSFTIAMRELCESIAVDGKREKLVLLLSSQTEKDPECFGCKSFFLAFTSACRSKTKVRVKKGDSPSATPTPVEIIDPSTVVLDQVSQLGISLSTATFAEKDDILKPMKKLLKVLRDRERITREPERYYFDVIATYLEAPFEEAFAKADRERKRSEKNSPEQAEAELDSLFN